MEPSESSLKSRSKQRQFLIAMRPLLKFSRLFGLLPGVFTEDETRTAEIALSRAAEKYTCAFIIVAYFGEFLVTRWSLAIKYEPEIILQFDWYVRMLLSILAHVS